MPSTNLTPSSDVTTTDWSNTGASTFSATLAASSGAGDGTHFVNQTSGSQSADPLWLGTTFSTSGIASINSGSATVAWLCPTKSATSEFQIELWNSGQTTKLANTAQQSTSSQSEVTANASLTIDDSTVADWANFRIKLIGSNTGDAQAHFFGLFITITYTATGPPGTPTNLVASNAGPTAVTLTWTQGSGTPTDNPIKYGTDGSSFGSSVDPGSAVTSYTITGLTYGQLYFFEVAASSSGGTSAYTSPVPWVCGSNWTGQVSQSSDDAKEVSGTVTLTDATISPTNGQYAGWRFQNALLANGVNIAKATLYLYFSSVSSPAGSFSIDCQLSTSAATFTTASNNISSRTLTGKTGGAGVGGSGSGWNNFPILAGAVQAVVNQPSWASGDPIAVPFFGDSGLTGITIEMQDGNPVQAAILAVFTPPIALSPIVTTAVQMSVHQGRQQPNQPQVRTGAASVVFTHRPGTSTIVQQTNAAVQAAAHQRQQQLPRTQVNRGLGSRLPANHIVRPLGCSVACNAAAQNALLHAQIQHIQILQMKMGRAAQAIRQTNAAVQAAARARQQTLPETQVLVGKTKAFVAPPPKTVFQVSGVQAATRNHGPAHTQVKKGMTARGMGQIIKQMAWAPVAPFSRHQPRQPPIGLRGPEPFQPPEPYRPARVPESSEYRPARVDPVETYIPMHVPAADDYRPRRVPGCGG
jgi:hypothetical protein